MKSGQLLNGENFKSIADIVVDADSLNFSRKYFDGAIVCCKTDYLAPFFAEVGSFSGRIALITHFSDYPITENAFRNRPPCIEKWYAQNVDFNHPDLIPLPIGLENNKGLWKGKYTDFGYWDEYDIGSDYQKDSLLYCNFTVENHPSRALWRDCLLEGEFSVQPLPVPYRDYIKEVKRHFFVASPRGNGIDCHRTWEALYHGAIPVVPRHFIYDRFPFPVVQVERPSQITQEALLEVKRRIQKGVFPINKEALTIKYWENIIRIGFK